MVSTFHDSTVAEDEYDICILHRGKTMRYDNYRSAFGGPFDGCLYQFLGFRVKAGGCFVEEEKAGISDQCAGDAYTLFLPAAEGQAALPYIRVVSYRELKELSVDR